MNKSQAGLIGSKVAVVFVSIGLIAASGILMLINRGSLIENLNLITKMILYPNVTIGIIACYAFGWIYGRYAGIIIIISNKDELWIGILTGFLTLLTATLVGSSVGLIRGLLNSEDLISSINDYLYEPLYGILIFGFIPTIVLGILFGNMIRNREHRNE
ncbi:hypothetical protein OKW21_006741 [Catalinimonas alkaloidigena]|uniref:hypothetical protein n=1 Tax=Catalinimonas alkaloidigena TaxID=1075417 RepID=UPI00240694A3|nr:hypothetical protein [Catalinimonas alkaloidigena]MDF9801432.1 hypothetical protein [Catalinimonas alkaloidigena]